MEQAISANSNKIDELTSITTAVVSIYKSVTIESMHNESNSPVLCEITSLSSIINDRKVALESIRNIAATTPNINTITGTRDEEVLKYMAARLGREEKWLVELRAHRDLLSLLKDRIAVLHFDGCRDVLNKSRDKCRENQDYISRSAF